MKISAVFVNHLGKMGAVTPGRLNSVREALGSWAQTEDTLPFGSVFRNQTAGQHILIAENQVTMGWEGDNLETSVTEWGPHLSRVLAALMIDTQSPSHIRVVARKQMPSSIMACSVKWAALTTPSSARGVGLRYILNEKDGRGDLRIEPLIHDPEFLFAELIWATKPLDCMAMLAEADNRIAWLKDEVLPPIIEEIERLC